MRYQAITKNCHKQEMKVFNYERPLFFKQYLPTLRLDSKPQVIRHFKHYQHLPS